MIGAVVHALALALAATQGVLLEDHARVADTINYELASRIETGPTRARRVVLDA